MASHALIALLVKLFACLRRVQSANTRGFLSLLDRVETRRVSYRCVVRTRMPTPCSEICVSTMSSSVRIMVISSLSADVTYTLPVGLPAVEATVFGVPCTRVGFALESEPAGAATPQIVAVTVNVDKFTTLTEPTEEEQCTGSL